MTNIEQLEQQSGELLRRVPDTHRREFVGRRYALMNAVSRFTPEDERRQLLTKLIEDIRACVQKVEGE